VSAVEATKRRRKIALFGGTFDPVHAGHIRVAEAALRKFGLDAIYFVPSAHPPHKKIRPLAEFIHRYAMVALACEGQRRYVPSLAEGPVEGGETPTCYSVDTVRRFRKQFPGEHIYLILGADSFLEIGKWQAYEDLLEACDFIVAGRPGFSLESLRMAIPPRMLAPKGGAKGNVIEMRKSQVNMLGTVKSHVSSTEIRRKRRAGFGIGGLTPRAVEEYIVKQHLYVSER
jgi:nicotinate-nucleotide adenylyltransferase